MRYGTVVGRERGFHRAGAVLSLLAATLLAAPALAAGSVDLALTDIRVSQSIRFTDTPLVANNVTFVRALIDPIGASGVTDDVDALLRVFIDGVEASWSPVLSINGPVMLPATPNESNIEDTVNFWFIAPESADVDLQVEVNPFGGVAETNFSNNNGSVNNLDFECRATVELVYVPIDYVPGGGVPDESVIEPGIGDAFLRAIYSPNEWDYHRYPLPPLVWTEDINGSNNDLLVELSDIRTFTLPSAGYAVPEFIYGWLPGNPFSGNGQANGIPGDAAFGNTQLSRHQRTFAHEIGHCLNEPHNGENVAQVGIDVEHHLFDTQGLDQLHASGQNDVMVAGQLTNTAFVSNETYVQVHGDSRLLCNPAPMPPAGASARMLRVAGILNHVERTARLRPVHSVERGTAHADRPSGEVWIIARDATGLEIHRVRAADGTSRDRCDGSGLDPESPIYALIPARPAGAEVASIEVVDIASGRILAEQVRSPGAPEIAFTRIIRADADEAGGPAVDLLGGGQRLTGRIRVEWTGADADADALAYMLLYSRDDGESWQPVALNLDGTSYEFDVDDIPASRGGQGRFRLLASDGLNDALVDTDLMGIGGTNAPDIYLLTPNDTNTFAEGGNVILHGYAYDAEDRTLSDVIGWRSDVDGPLGTGSLIQVSGLSVGAHTILATVTDSGGNMVSTSIDITVTPRLPLLSFSYPGGLPLFIAPSGETIRVSITGNDATVDPTSPELFYDIGAGFVSVPLVPVGGDEYEASFPPTTCGSSIAFYVRAETTSGEVRTDPGGAPANAFVATSAAGELVAFSDDFETNQGWVTEILGATSGEWQRGVPVNDPDWAYDPATDGDGSGQCFLTQNEVGNTDVDEGAVRLTSPPLDLSADGVLLRYRYYLRLTNEDGSDRLLVEASANGQGGPWLQIALHTTNAEGWRTNELTQAQLEAAGLTLTSDVRLRFTANDADAQSIVESGVDGVIATALDCTMALFGDVDGDGDVDFNDLVAVLAAWGPCPAPPAACPADFTGDGIVGFDDLLGLLAAWTG